MAVSILTQDELDALLETVRAEEREQCARLLCRLCRVGHRPVRNKGGNWEHRDPWDHDTQGCEGNVIRKRGPQPP